MGIATPPIFGHHLSSNSPVVIQTVTPNYPSAVKSMSRDYQPDIFNFSGNGFERSNDQDQHRAQQHYHMAQQICRGKLHAQGFEPMVGIEEDPGNLQGYETAGGMLSEMFNFASGSGGGGPAEELLDHSMQAAAAGGFRMPRAPPPPPPLLPGISGGDWYSKSQAGHHNISNMNADSAAAMQLFLMNPQRRSPSPPHQTQAARASSSTLNMLLPNPSPSSSLQGISVSSISAGGFTGVGSMMAPPPPPPQQFSFGVGGSSTEIGGGFIEGQGLSLSLSSSLQHLEAAKVETLRNMGSDGLLFYNHDVNNSPASASSQYPASKLSFDHGQNYPQAHVGYGSSLGIVNVLRSSKYLKAAQELLEEFCSVGRGHLKKAKPGRSENPNSANSAGGGNDNNNCGGGSSSSSSKENHPLSAADRMEHQRRKVKLLSMLDEVDRRYNNYCEQMQMVVNSFDLVMGFKAAVPYTALAQKAMSRHFRCLKDAIAAQLRYSCEQLGEKEGTGTSGITKGETPRLKILDQSLRQQRGFYQMGMMEQEAWRPQRGLPERSINILRAWLFEHFLHPYPSDADKHLLARQTGLSRNQVSNWFINARVRLWKPMVEEMYQQESKEEDTDQDDTDQNPTSSGGGGASSSQRPETSVAKSDPSRRHSLLETPLPKNDKSSSHLSPSTAAATSFTAGVAGDAVPSTIIASINQGHFNHRMDIGDDFRPSGSFPPEYAAAAAGNTSIAQAAVMRFGTTAGDVSLTLGLRHAGNMQEKNSFQVTEFRGC
ncbi:hypothetical protein SAY86_032210 [Trapa natans]|uniref:Homeobox domain-containing protein n=1 Tax=Trapa natans TaxID=22666 RepID=A0AAN7M4N8_TRANT|nr:hypothetical protein SAY86_032210 [Trapa natans]